MTVFESPVLSLIDQVDAAEAAVEAFNGRGGVGGHCMELTTCDTGLDPNGEVVPEGTTDGVAQRIVDGPPMALSVTKRMLDNAATSSLIQALETEAIAQNVNLGTADMAEAMQAFAEKRPPVFQGR